MTRQQLIDDFQHFLDTHKEKVQSHICQPPYDWMDEDDLEDEQQICLKQSERETKMNKYYFSYATQNGFGFSIIEMKSSMITENDILTTKENIKKWNNIQGDIVILSWQKLAKD